MGGDRPIKKKKNNLVPNSIHTWPGEENFEKNSKKIQKTKKNLFPALFLAKTGRDTPRKKEKNFSAKFFSFSARGRKFRKK